MLENLKMQWKIPQNLSFSFFLFETRITSSKTSITLGREEGNGPVNRHLKNILERICWCTSRHYPLFDDFLYSPHNALILKGEIRQWSPLWVWGPAQDHIKIKSKSTYWKIQCYLKYSILVLFTVHINLFLSGTLQNNFLG